MASTSRITSPQPDSRPALGQKLLDWLIIIIVALMPFHAFLAVSLGTNFGHQALIQSWKEVVLVLMMVLIVATRRLPDIVAVLRRRTNLAIIAFAVLALTVSLASGAYRQPAFWFGVKTDLGFLLVFMLAQFGSRPTRKMALTVFLVSATIVAAFGTLQATILPADFLTRFGYGPDTILPYTLVDPAVDAIRIVSTLGGSNQLGSFLILPICIMSYLLFKKRRWLWLVPLSLCLVTIWHSYSRSALIGLVVALGTMALIGLGRKARIAVLVVAAIIIIALAAGGWRQLVSNRTIGAYLLHGRIENNQIQGSDAGRIESLNRGLSVASQQPLGKGLGTAGPASNHGSRDIITENYYLQIAIETGLLGLLLFGLIVILSALDIRRSADLPGTAILAALVGLSVSNLLLHTWADSSTALTFWTLAGLAAGGAQDEVT